MILKHICPYILFQSTIVQMVKQVCQLLLLTHSFLLEVRQSSQHMVCILYYVNSHKDPGALYLEPCALLLFVKTVFKLTKLR